MFAHVIPFPTILATAARIGAESSAIERGQCSSSGDEPFSKPLASDLLT